MDKHLSQIENTRNKIVALCGKLQWLFFACFVFCCIVFLAIVVFSILLPFGSSYLGPSSAISLLPVMLNVVAGGYALWLVTQMLRKIGKGLSPFSLSVARQIKALAVVLLAGVALGILIEPGSQIGVTDESGTHRMAYEHGGSSDSDVFIDVKGLLTSIICFALSTVFRYGAALQQEADDLV